MSERNTARLVRACLSMGLPFSDVSPLTHALLWHSGPEKEAVAEYLEKSLRSGLFPSYETVLREFPLPRPPVHPVICAVSILDPALRSRTADYMALLPPERQERVRQARTWDKQAQQLCAGLLLQSITGEQSLCFGPHGKPFLPEGPEFSLTHSGDWVLMAVSDCPIGLDWEMPRPLKRNVPARICRPEELRWLGSECPPHKFFYLWTRKEAAAKCLGLGLALPFSSFSALEERTAAENTELYLDTLRWPDRKSCLSVASVCPFPKPKVRVLCPDELLNHKENHYGIYDPR